MKLSKWIAVLVISGITSIALPVMAAPPAAQQLAAASEQSQVNINQAGAELIAETLTGMGLKRAQAIVSFRNTHGPFKSAEDLLQVKGFGEATLQKNRAKISF